MFDEVFHIAIPLFGMGLVGLWVAGSFLTGIMNHIRLHRALELRAAERLALVQRGLDPRTHNPLPVSNPPGDDACA